MNYKDIEKEFDEKTFQWICELVSEWRFRLNSGKGSDKSDLMKKIQKRLNNYQKAKINLVIDDMIGEGVKIEEKKFPRGERKWCIECARRIKKELKDYKKKFNE